MSKGFLLSNAANRFRSMLGYTSSQLASEPSAKLNDLFTRVGAELQAITEKNHYHMPLEPTFRYNCGDPIINIGNVISQSDVESIETLATRVRQTYPEQFESRSFEHSPVLYSGDELLINDESINLADGGGNDVVFLEGFLQKAMPLFVERLLSVASLAANRAKWHPHPRQLGIRCIEQLHYYTGGEVRLHTDSESIFTFVVMLSDSFGEEFTGGDFVIERKHENNKGQNLATTPIIVRSSPRRGDCIMFDSNAKHGVEPVLTGHRRVLVLELWPFEDAKLGDRRPSAHQFRNKVKIPELLMA
jgi:hypothetical protein